MLKASFDNLKRKYDAMVRELAADAESHLVGKSEQAAAGLLFVASAQLRSVVGQWANVVQLIIEDPEDDGPRCLATGCFSAAVEGTDRCAEHAAKPKACRHDYVASETRGEKPPRCSKCNNPKNPNGRPRVQQLVKPAGAE